MKDKAKFEKVYTTGYSIAWSDELEIDAISIYLDFTGKDFGDISIQNFLMPQVSYFLGVIIRMFYRDHNPPHFHAVYGDNEAIKRY